MQVIYKTIESWIKNVSFVYVSLQETWKYLANLYQQLGRYEESKTWFTRLADETPEIAATQVWALTSACLCKDKTTTIKYRNVINTNWSDDADLKQKVSVHLTL